MEWAGKTTLLTRLIPNVLSEGLRVSVVKHAHHDFDIDVPRLRTYQDIDVFFAPQQAPERQISRPFAYRHQRELLSQFIFSAGVRRLSCVVGTTGPGRDHRGRHRLRE